MFKLKKTLLIAFTVCSLLLCNAMSAFAVTSDVLSKEQQSSVQKEQKVHDALKQIGTVKVKPGEKVQKTINVDDIKYVITYSNTLTPSNELTSSSSANSMLAAASNQNRTLYCVIDAYNNADMWMYSVTYKNAFVYNGTTVSASKPAWQYQKASFMIFATFGTSDMEVSNFGSYSYSSGLCHITVLDTYFGQFLTNYYNGQASMYADGSFDASIV